MRDPEYVAQLVGQLVDGVRERIEYSVNVGGRVEARAQAVKHPPILVQLRQAVVGQKSREECEGGSATRVASPHPGDLDASDMLYRIREEARTARNALLRSLGQQARRGGRHLDTPKLLRALPVLAGETTDHALVSDVKRHLGALVREARVILGYDQPMRMLADTVCGNCSGALIVAADASTDVRCIGHPDTPSCGTVYRRHEWIDLLET